MKNQTHLKANRSKNQTKLTLRYFSTHPLLSFLHLILDFDSLFFPFFKEQQKRTRLRQEIHQSLITKVESSYSLIHHKEPCYKSLKPFGCVFYPCIKLYNQHKLEFHTTNCVFLGYINSQKGYKCIKYHWRIFAWRRVILNDHQSPFLDGFINPIGPLKTITKNSSIYIPLCIGNFKNNFTTQVTKEAPPNDINLKGTQETTV